ncbi:MAG: FlgD immunoglobulin-like domain containing protein [bacterium]
MLLKSRLCMMFVLSLMAFLFSNAIAGVIPTNEWINIFSANTTLDGSPIPVGSVINAYDPGGVLCGTFTVQTQGQFGFLLVYRDDTTTPSVDEGANPGDEITFFINGVYAICFGPDNPVWTSNGAIVQIDLEGHSNYAPVISGFPAAIMFRSDTTHIMNLDDLVSDINDTDSDLSWSVTGGDSVCVNINPSTQVVEFSASLTFSGKDTLIFTVTDNMAASDCDTIIVEIIPYIRTMPISLNSGWNLISWDIDSPVDSVSILFADIMDNISVVLGFESGGFTFNPDLPQFSTLKLVDHLHGYWIKTNSTDILNITGSEVGNDTPISLEAGWNLVSYLPENPDSISHALESIIDKVIVVLGFDEGGLTYDPNWPQFSNLQILSSGFGYWIKVSEACTLVYPDTQVADALSLAKRTTYLTNSRSINPTNEWISVFSTNKSRPGSVFQAKDPDGIICGESKVGEDGFLRMLPVYRDDPDTEIDEGAQPGDVIEFYLDGIKLGDYIIWRSFGEVHQLVLKIDTNNISETFHLSQNYPNPFNPTTKIQYNLPEDSHVNLVIYNILGEQIRVLVNEDRGVGYHTVSWDGKNGQGEIAPSGVYYYQINAGNYTQTQKMIFLR